MSPEDEILFKIWGISGYTSNPVSDQVDNMPVKAIETPQN